MTKCDIDLRLLRTNNKYPSKARILLTTLYNVRNNYAHGNYKIPAYIDNVREVLSDVNSMSEFKSTLRLLIPVQYPANINNFILLLTGMNRMKNLIVCSRELRCFTVVRKLNLNKEV